MTQQSSLPVAEGYVLCQQQQSVLQITLNRPQKKNALDQQMYRDLSSALQRAESDDSIHVVLLQGAEHCFSAGNDLQDFLGAGELNSEHPTVQFLYTLAGFSKPLVAAVSGLAIGIGTTALLHCDLVYASEQVRFAMPFTQLGLCPEAGASVLLPALIGHQRACQYLLLGDSFDSQQALQMGLVSQLVPAAELNAFALTQAQRLAAKSLDALVTSKALLKQQQRPLTLQAIAAELTEFQRLLETEQCQAQIAAFFKR